MAAKPSSDLASASKAAVCPSWALKVAIGPSSVAKLPVNSLLLG